MKLGDLTWRVDPTSVDWNFQMDTTVINTLGGQVVQILGATLSDLVITGDLGQDHKNNKMSWQLAAAFHQKIKSFMDQQTLPPKNVGRAGASAAGGAAGRGAGSAVNSGPNIGTFGGKGIGPSGGVGSAAGKAAGRAVNSGILTDAGAIHAPLPLTYHDGVHNWSFRVLVKSLDDADGSGSLNITNGKFNYQYRLTLFIVEADSEKVKKVASDFFLSRLSDGIGWSRTKFNGPLKAQDAQDFITINGGTVSAFLDKVITGEPLQSPTATGPVVGRRPGHGVGAI